MNKKGQAALQLGVIIMVFITVLVGVILFQTVAQEAGKSSATAIQNDSGDLASTTGPANGTITDLPGQEILSTPVVINASDGTDVSGNYSIFEGVSANTGVKSIQIKTIDDGGASQPINISYTYGQDGYVESSGSRAVIGLIAIFFALAIAVIALSPTLRSGVLNMVNR